MCALRRLPFGEIDKGSSKPPEHGPIIPLGVVELNFSNMAELEALIRRKARGVKVYAGEGVAPRGVKDLDDATSSELSDIKITATQPSLTLRLGSRGAFFSGRTRSAKAAKLQDEIVQWIKNHPATRLHYTFFWPTVGACILWHLSNVVAGVLSEISVQPSNFVAWIAGLAFVANMTGAIFMVWSDFSLARRLKRQGAAFVIRRPRLVPKLPVWNRFTPHNRARLLIAFSMGIHAIIGVLFYGWLD